MNDKNNAADVTPETLRDFRNNLVLWSKLKPEYIDSNIHRIQTTIDALRARPAEPKEGGE